MLASLSALKDELSVGDSVDDAKLLLLLETAEATLGIQYALPTVPRATESRTAFADGAFLPLAECVSVSGVTDEDGNVLAFNPRPGRRTADHMLGLRLHSRYTGQVTVAGVWGYLRTPPDVADAILSMAASAYKRRNISEGFGSLGDVGSAITKKAHDIMRARRGALM